MRTFVLTLLSVVLCATAVLAAAAEGEAGELVVVGYLPEYRLDRWSPTQDGAVTDLVFFGITLPENGEIPAEPVRERRLAAVAKFKEQMKCRLLITVGGWGRSRGFPTMTLDADKRQEFIAAMLRFCQQHAFDGVDYDWEHPKGRREIEAYAALLQETHAAFAEHGMLVTVAQAGWQDLGQAAYEAVDRVHLMSYDHDYPHATLAKSKADVERLIGWGCPPGKIALGAPFYGRNQQRDARTYAQLVRSGDNSAEIDEVDGYAFNGPRTMRAKVDFAREKKLAGLMVWELGQDARGESSLLGAISDQISKPANE